MASTLAQLRTRVREKVDEETAAFWSDTLINNQLNEGYRLYWSFILKHHEGYFTTSSNISFDANSAGEYDLPADFFSVRLVSRLLSSCKVPMRNYERYDEIVGNTLGNVVYNLPDYRLKGNKIKFEPAPDFLEINAIEIEYVKKLSDLSALVNVDSEFPPLAEDCMVLRATIKCKEIEEMIEGGGADTVPFIRDLQTTEQLLKEIVEQRVTARRYVASFGDEME